MNPEHHNAACIVIGIDGASFDVIRPLVEAGQLPNFSALIANGASGILEPSMPVLSPSIWTSIVTGRNPAQHGIFDFLRFDLARGKILFNSAADRKAPPLWVTLGQQGRRVCVGGLIMTFPPDAVNGLMYSGLVTDITTHAGDAEGISRAYPPELEKDIETHVGIFTMAEDIREDRAFVQEMLASLDYRIRLYRYLSRRGPFDFQMFYFPETDHVSHRGWCDRGTAAGVGGLFADIYRRIDAFLGELRADPDLNIVLVSDHGFREVRRAVSINNALERLGYLRYRPLSAAERVVSFTRRVVNRLFGQGRKDLLRGMRLEELLTGIDWAHTRAFYFGTSGGTIFLNLKGRSPAGLVDPADADRLSTEIAGRLKEIRDEETGAPVFHEVYTRRQLFAGPHAEAAPDLYAVFEPDYLVAMRKDDRYRGRRIVTPQRMWTGDHDLRGIFVACGPRFRAGAQVPGIRAVDVAPTLLYALGAAIPGDMDGRILTDAMDPAYASQTPPVFDQATMTPATAAAPTGVYSEADQKNIEQRLKDLGYL